MTSPALDSLPPSTAMGDATRCLMVMPGIKFTLVSNFWILLLAAVIGVISPAGNEIGPFRATEEIVEGSERFSQYTFIGASVAGSYWITLPAVMKGLLRKGAYWVVFWGGVLSKEREAVKGTEEGRTSVLVPESRGYCNE